MAKIPSLRKLFEVDETQFGSEISAINKWFKTKYDKSNSFNWNGKELVVKDVDDKETETISRADLSKEVDLPTTTNESYSPAAKVFGKKIVKSITDSSRELNDKEIMSVLNSIVNMINTKGVDNLEF